MPNTWDAASIRHASYTLRLGGHVEIAYANRAASDERRDFVVQDLRQGDSLALNPGDTAKLYSIEILDIPDSVLAFTVARGLMYIEALVPENTYADPGFTGDLYTTVTNLSNRIVRLNYGDPIARLFLFHLAEPVQESFRRGAARGILQRLESERATKLGTPQECHQSDTTQLVSEIQRNAASSGPAIVELLQRQNRRRAALFVIAVVWPVLLVLANMNSWIKNTLGLVVSNIAAVILSALISWLALPVWQRIKRA